MSNEEGAKAYRLALPLKIWIKGSKVVISDGMVSLEHSGEILLNSISRNVAEFKIELKEQTKLTIPKELEGGFIHEFNELAKIRSGGILADYHYYKRKEDGAYIAVVYRGRNKRSFHLGSLLDQKSLSRRTLDYLPVGQPLYKRELYEKMPRLLKHGQIVKAVLDVLVHEGFLKVKATNGLKEEFAKVKDFNEFEYRRNLEITKKEMKAS